MGLGVERTKAPASTPSDSPVLRYIPSRVEPNACRGDCTSIPYLFSLGQPPNKQLPPTKNWSQGLLLGECKRRQLF